MMKNKSIPYEIKKINNFCNLKLATENSNGTKRDYGARIPITWHKEA